MGLSSAEQKNVRGIAQRLEPAVHVGKGGLTDTSLAQIDVALSRDGTIKIRFVQHDRKSRAALCRTIEEKTGADLCGTVGNTASFFRPKPE